MEDSTGKKRIIVGHSIGADGFMHFIYEDEIVGRGDRPRQSGRRSGRRKARLGSRAGSRAPSRATKPSPSRPKAPGSDADAPATQARAASTMPERRPRTHQPLPASSPPMWSCPRCGILVKPHNIPTHILGVHEGVTPSVRRRGKQPARPTARCEICNATVSTKNLPKHLWKVHGATSPQSRPKPRPARRAQSQSAGRHRSASPRIQRVSLDAIADEDVRDATRHTGFPARERGRYGSHPLHDEFSDEGDAW
jgi:hypothetical protein